MRDRAMGRGLRLSELGLGTSQLGNLYRVTTDDEARGAVDAAWETGIRYFDTAPHYGLGLSERRLGAALRVQPRDEFVISTKVGRLLVETPGNASRQDEDFVVPAHSRREWDFSAAGVRSSLEQSLERLGLDRIDVVYLHDPDDHYEQAISEALPELGRMRDEGLVGAIGAGMNQSAMLARFILHADVDVLMVAGRFTLLDGGALGDLLPLALEHGVDVVVAGVYNSGLLGSERVSSTGRFDYKSASPELVGRAAEIARVCELHGVTLPAAAIAYPLLHPAVVSVVVGCRTPDQVRGNVERYTTAVPDSLWRDLQHAGLLPADFPQPISTGAPTP